MPQLHFMLKESAVYISIYLSQLNAAYHVAGAVCMGRQFDGNDARGSPAA